MNLNHSAAFCLAAVVMFCLAPAAAHSESSYRSPDKALEATILSVHHTKTGQIQQDSSPESIVVIEKEHGKQQLCKLDLSSVDGEHGYIVDHSAWTPNSRFFVFAVNSSGGHQPWASPTYVYCSRTNKFYDLEQTPVGATTDPDFRLLEPDILVTEALGTNGNMKTPVKVSLSKLLAKSR